MPALPASFPPLQRLAGVAAGSNPQTQFVYDGSQISEELVSGAVARRYVPGSDGTPLVWYEG